MMRALRGHFLGIAIAVMAIIAPITGVVSAQAEHEMMHFATFTPNIETKLPDEFEVEAVFTLGTESNGIDPLAENVILHIENFFTTIEKGSFKQNKAGRFDFEGVVNGVKLDAKIEQLEDGSFLFKAEGKGADLGLTGTENSVMVGLAIGDDCGCAMVTPEFE